MHVTDTEVAHARPTYTAAMFTTRHTVTWARWHIALVTSVSVAARTRAYITGAVSTTVHTLACIRLRLAIVAAVPGSASALIDRGRVTLLHRPLHRRENLSVSRFCSQGFAAVEVVRHQHSRAPGVAARRLTAAAVLRRLIAALVRHSVRTVGQVGRLACPAVTPLCAGPAVQAR
jgi:hypothetical protein